MREKTPPEPPPEVPVWFMTFSDVITLMMTFFILLLTFASSEPEKFDRLQRAVFQGAGGTGAAGDPPPDVERDSIVDRVRPRSARLTMKGSSMPPVDSDPAMNAVGDGLMGLEDADRRPTADRHEMNVSMALLFDGDQLSSTGLTTMEMLGNQLRKMPFDVTLVIPSSEHRGRALSASMHLLTRQGVRPGRVGLREDTAAGLPDGKMKILLTRQHRPTN